MTRGCSLKINWKQPTTGMWDNFSHTPRDWMRIPLSGLPRRSGSEHRAMLDWQNRITDERYRFFGIEVKVWQIEDSARAVQFDVVSSPNDWSSRCESGYTTRSEPRTL